MPALLGSGIKTSGISALKALHHLPIPDTNSLEMERVRILAPLGFNLNKL
jgi:hypothetical protein